MTTVWIYVDTSKDVGDKDHLKVFASEPAAEVWFKDNDPGGRRRRMYNRGRMLRKSPCGNLRSAV
jgi:hypothetical protein